MSVDVLIAGDTKLVLGPEVVNHEAGGNASFGCNCADAGGGDPVGGEAPDRSIADPGRGCAVIRGFY